MKKIGQLVTIEVNQEKKFWEWENGLKWCQKKMTLKKCQLK